MCSTARKSVLKPFIQIAIVSGIVGITTLPFFALTFSDLILLATAVIVFFYMRATQQANELQTRPVLMLSFEETTQPGGGSRNGRIKAKNIGKGLAYDVHFQPFILNEEPRGFFTYMFYLDNRVLEAGEEHELRMRIATPGDGAEASDMMRFLFRLIPGDLLPEVHKKIQAETPALFVVNYKSLDGQHYHSIYRLYSVLPPVGDIVMQPLHQGRGRRGILWARWYHLIKPTIPHERSKKPTEHFLAKLFAFIQRNLK